MISRTLRRVAGPLTLALAALAAAGVSTVGSPSPALAFPQETETQGEIDVDLNGVWLVVHHLKFNRPTPKATPAAGEQPPATRIFNVLNLFKITHLGKEEAQKERDARQAKLEASVAKAEAIVAKKAKEQIPMETEEGKIEGAGARVVVPQIPRPPGYDPAIHAGDKIEISLLDVVLPASVEESFQAAQKAETAYEPSDKDLALLGSSWSELEIKKDSEYSRIEWKVIAPAHYDQGLQNDPNLQNTKLTISGTQGMVPRPSQPNRNIVVYGIREVDGDVLSGSHNRAMMATAPFPIPIEMSGEVRMIKIADLPSPKPKAADEADDAGEADEKAEKQEQPAS